MSDQPTVVLPLETPFTFDQLLTRLKPGYKSVEFWIAAVAIAGVLAGMFGGIVPGSIGAGLLTFKSIVFAIIRTLDKNNQIQGLIKAINSTKGT